MLWLVYEEPCETIGGFFSKKLEALFSLPYDKLENMLLIEQLSVFAVDRR